MLRVFVGSPDGGGSAKNIVPNRLMARSKLEGVTELYDAESARRAAAACGG